MWYGWLKWLPLYQFPVRVQHWWKIERAPNTATSTDKFLLHWEEGEIRGKVAVVTPTMTSFKKKKCMWRVLSPWNFTLKQQQQQQQPTKKKQRKLPQNCCFVWNVHLTVPLGIVIVTADQSVPTKVQYLICSDLVNLLMLSSGPGYVCVWNLPDTWVLWQVSNLWWH